jgi:hypothetical protein
MCAEACLCATPKATDKAPSASIFSIDRDLRWTFSSGGSRHGGVRVLIDEEHALLLGRQTRPSEAVDGLAFLFQLSSEHDVVPLSLAFELDCFSGPDGDSGQSSIGARSVVDQMLLDDVGDVVRVMSDVAQDSARRPLPAEDFIARFKKPLTQPVLTSTPRLCKSKNLADDDDEWIPRRSARLAAKSQFRADKP